MFPLPFISLPKWNDGLQEENNNAIKVATINLVIIVMILIIAISF
jgi:hypothetical protein